MGYFDEIASDVLGLGEALDSLLQQCKAAKARRRRPKKEVQARPFRGNVILGIILRGPGVDADVPGDFIGNGGQGI